MSDINGTCGENLTWTLTDDGTLTIRGSGEMWDYDDCDYVDNWADPCPWYRYREQIQKAEIQNGVTSIGDYAFYECSRLKRITLPDSVTSIGDEAFGDDRFMLTVKSVGTDEVKYKILVAPYVQTWDEPQKLWDEVMSGNFTSYDFMFQRLNTDDRIMAAITRLQYPFALSVGQKTFYHICLFGEEERAAQLLIDAGNMEGLLCLAQSGIITKTNVDAMIDYAIEKGAVEFTAYLMNYKNELTEKKRK